MEKPPSGGFSLPRKASCFRGKTGLRKSGICPKKPLFFGQMGMDFVKNINLFF
jgi:hypothetical protein